MEASSAKDYCYRFFYIDEKNVERSLVRLLWSKYAGDESTRPTADRHVIDSVPFSQDRFKLTNNLTNILRGNA